jgi:signal transduction histidine kinase/CheY-like chemotaxis protein
LVSPWTRGFVTWLACSTVGWLAVALVAPHGVQPSLYLALGLGLACILTWGPWMVLPAALAAASVAWLQGASAAGSLLALASVSCALAVASAATQRWMGRDVALDTPRDVGLFFLLSGLLATFAGALIATLGGVWLDLPTAHGLVDAGLNRWAADATGVLLGTPLALTVIGRPADLWRPRRWPVGVPLLVTVVLLTSSVRQIDTWQHERENWVFEHDVAATSTEVRLRLKSYLDALAAMDGVFIASEQVTQKEFARAAGYWLQHLQGVKAIGWNERVPAASRAAFEARVQAEGQAGFHVFDAPDHRPSGAGEVAVIRYVEPFRGNEQALGFNVLSSAVARAAYERARSEHRVAASGGLRLIQEEAQQTGIVVYHPVYKGHPGGKAAEHVGAVFLALRVDDTLASMLHGVPPYLAACLRDASAPGEPTLGDAHPCERPARLASHSHHVDVPLSFAGRDWVLEVWNREPIPLVGQGASTWLLGFGGLAFAAALVTLLLVMTGHAHRIEAAMAEARRQRLAAELASNAKTDFLSRMSHELRTPLNAVLGFAQVMGLDQRDPLSPGQRQRIEQIQQAGWHLLDLIDDVLDVSRLDSGTLCLQAQPLPIQDELAASAHMLRGQADEAGVRLSLPTQLPASWGVHADAGRLRQILGNLLRNAIVYNHRGGEVSVAVDHTDQAGTRMLRIAVRDTGMGLSEEQLTQLFQPFNRLGREQGPTSGTGIGLVISRHLAQLMGGSLTASGRPGEGATFTLCLPARDLAPPASTSVTGLPPTAAASAPAATPAPVPAPPPVSARSPRPVGADKVDAADTLPHARHVLYVEDNLANSELVRSALAARPWVSVTVAPTTEEGLSVLHNRLRGSRPDLILLDVHLPDASGIELLNLIKSNPETASIPVIMISADAMPEQIDAALNSGASCYLTKPVQLAELLRQVDDLMPA